VTEGIPDVTDSFELTPCTCRMSGWGCRSQITRNFWPRWVVFEGNGQRRLMMVEACLCFWLVEKGKEMPAATICSRGGTGECLRSLGYPPQSVSSDKLMMCVMRLLLAMRCNNRAVLLSTNCGVTGNRRKQTWIQIGSPVAAVLHCSFWVSKRHGRSWSLLRVVVMVVDLKRRRTGRRWLGRTTWKLTPGWEKGGFE
jgi:hypothetical protein